MLNSFETSATVGGQGDIHLAALPFQPGTEVEVVVSPKASTAVVDEQLRADKLFAALDLARNSDSIGRLHRDDLYDRDNIH